MGGGNKRFAAHVSVQICPTWQILHQGLEDKVILLDCSTRIRFHLNMKNTFKAYRWLASQM